MNHANKALQPEKHGTGKSMIVDRYINPNLVPFCSICHMLKTFYCPTSVTVIPSWGWSDFLINDRMAFCFMMKASYCSKSAGCFRLPFLSAEFFRQREYLFSQPNKRKEGNYDSDTLCSSLFNPNSTRFWNKTRLKKLIWEIQYMC